MPETRKKRPSVDAPADGWMSVAKAAAALGIAYNTVCAKALRGELQSQTFAGRVFIHRDSVQNEIASRERKVS